MPRKPNYRFERTQRERAKAEKKARKEEKRRQRSEGEPPAETSDFPPNATDAPADP